MHVRAATFEIPTEMKREDGEKVVSALRERITSQGGPEGAERVLVLVDAEGRRGLNLTFFDTAEHMQAAEAFFDAMTPVQVDGVESGRRIEVRHFELMMDQEVARA